jgi:general nucleoside transport system permease protein
VKTTHKRMGWAGVALGVIAGFISVTPAIVHEALPSIILAAIGIGLGCFVVRDERRLGIAAIAIGIAAIIGAFGAAHSSAANLRNVFTWSALIAATLRYATPLLFAALGGIVSERSGVINIGLEGMMLMGAFFSILGADVTGSWVGGLAVAMLAGGALAGVHALFSIHLRADQIVSGTAINFLALGITGYIYLDHYGPNGTPNNVSVVPNISLPGVRDIGFVGDAIGHTNLLTWIALLLVPVLTVFLFRTKRGLRLRAVGEKPHAADTVGVRVFAVRYAAVIASGMLAALGGAYLSSFVGSFSQNMTEGRGFIALAAVIFGKWRPLGALMAVLLFGFSSALAQRLPTFSSSTATLFQALPYVLTLVAVAGVVGRSRAPGSIGIPFVKG